MNNTYFTLDDNFEKIIKNTLNDKEIISLKQIPTGWTNIVYEVQHLKVTFSLDFLEMSFGLEQLLKIMNLPNIFMVKQTLIL